MSEEWLKVCNEEDLVTGSGICALVGTEQVALFREEKDKKVYAISNFDPFGEVNVLSRGIIGSIGDQLVVASPLYKQHFCLKSGQCLEDEAVQVKSYAVKILDGSVFIKQ